MFSALDGGPTLETIEVVVLNTSSNIKDWVDSLPINISGLVPNPRQADGKGMDVCHAWRIARREDVARYDGGWSIESCFQEEEHPCDAVLMAKELSCSDCLAQVPLVIMPYRLMERLIAKPMKQSARLQLSADKIKECNPESVFNKTAKDVAADPWWERFGPGAPRHINVANVARPSKPAKRARVEKDQERPAGGLAPAVAERRVPLPPPAERLEPAEPAPGPVGPAEPAPGPAERLEPALGCSKCRYKSTGCAQCKRPGTQLVMGDAGGEPEADVTDGAESTSALSAAASLWNLEPTAPQPACNDAFVENLSDEDQVPSVAALQNQEAGDVPCTLPGKEGDTACVSIAINKISFATAASLREPPSLDASRKLFGRFPAEGFLTETEPLLFHYHDMAPDEMIPDWFYNLSTSHRGQIRKAPSAISFVYGLSSVGSTDPQETLKLWNARAPKTDQVSGRKQGAVQTLLAIDKTHLELIHSIVSEFSFEGCPFSDDSLSSKKLYPGAAFTSRLGKNSPWRPRLVVTSHSFELFIQMIRQQHKSSVHKGKLPKATMEEKAEICAAASALGLEVLRSDTIL
ncbi:hypothetical protein AK812_SmicGene3082 [Symbiodinium microadriaticum]|uniref:Uncharacterized protein n=1 Tax=Symbiodinium microadriaticum TaxID=2951 RepID=A0A1Q9F058_SYMMI|nr:hypothetical protein AK812_SmicGene3082 [Symbiodinium microadriaticum]